MAEDNVINAHARDAHLGKMGNRVDVAGNGDEALEALARQPYDLVLMDVQMPEMDGLEATRVIVRRWPKDERPYIIGLSADAMTIHRDLALAAGMDDYIVKPMDPRKLHAALSKVQQRRDVGVGVDVAVIRSLAEDLGADGAAEVLHSFLEETPTLIERLHAAVHAKDGAALGRAAHALKSPAQACGLPRIGALCQELEASASDADWAAAAVRMSAIAEGWEEARGVLERFTHSSLPAQPAPPT